MPPQLVVILLSLAVAVYMVASLFVPPLRFIFRMKRGPAALIGMDEDDQRRLSDGLALVLAPIIALLALGFAFHTAVGWRNEARSAREREAELANRREASFESLRGRFLGDSPDEVSFPGSRPELALADGGAERVATFLERLGEELRVEDLGSSRPLPQNTRGWLTARYEGSGERDRALVIAMDFRGPMIHVSGLAQGSTVWFEPPPTIRGEFEALGELETIDLDRQRKEALRRQRDEKRKLDLYHDRLRAYRGKVHAGPSPDEALRQGEAAVGQEVEWELMLVFSIQRSTEGVLTSNGTQRFRQGEALPVAIVGAADAFPEAEALGEVWWIRLTGVIESVDRQVHVRFSEVEPFTPEVRDPR